MTTPSFSDLMQTMRSFQESRLLLTAVELDVFTAVGKGGSASQVAATLKTNPRATETFLNALVAIGALAKQDGIFRNTPETARHLVAGSPEYARPALMHTVHMWRAWSSLTDSVRSGTAAAQPGVEADDAQWTESFIAAMHRNAETTAAALVRAVGADGVRRMLDVGGGSGAYSITFAKANPNLRAEVLDLASVVPIAQRHIDAAGLSGRVVTRVGDLTKDDLGRGGAQSTSVKTGRSSTTRRVTGVPSRNVTCPPARHGFCRLRYLMTRVSATSGGRTRQKFRPSIRTGRRNWGFRISMRL
jgi:hypothetical protein